MRRFLALLDGSSSTVKQLEGHAHKSGAAALAYPCDSAFGDPESGLLHDFIEYAALEAIRNKAANGIPQTGHCFVGSRTLRGKVKDRTNR